MKSLRLLSCVLATASGTSLAQRFEAEVGAVGSGFLTTYSGSRNILFGGYAHLRYTDIHFEFEGDLQASNKPVYPVLGNIETLQLRFGDQETQQISFGRMKARRSFIRNIGIQESMNQRVCYDAFDCRYGGFWGASFRFFDRFELGIELASPPDIQGTGASDRWSALPLSYYPYQGQMYALRSTTILPLSFETFFKPGAWIDVDLIRRNTYRLRYMAHFGASRRAMPTAFLGTLTATSRAQISYPYRQLHTLQGILNLGGVKLVGEGSAERLQQGIATDALRHNAGIFLEPELRGFFLRAGGGYYRDLRTSYFAQGGAFWFHKRLRVGGLAEAVFGSGSRTAFYVHPEVAYVYAKRSEVALSGDLLFGNEGALFYGPLRQNDQIQLRLGYAFD